MRNHDSDLSFYQDKYGNGIFIRPAQFNRYVSQIQLLAFSSGAVSIILPLTYQGSLTGGHFVGVKYWRMYIKEDLVFIIQTHTNLRVTIRLIVID